MRLTYVVNEEAVILKETLNGKDTEFEIQLRADSSYIQAMRDIQQLFESNRDFSDVYFYIYPQHLYKVIVRQDYLEAFILELMRHRLLRRVEWQ